MPEFILDHGSPEGSRSFETLEDFTQGYIEAMFFTSTGYAENGDLEEASVAELAPETLQRICKDCDDFAARFQELLNEATMGASDYCLTQAGRDFWYTRCGHGVGFWSRTELPDDLGTALTDAAGRYPSLDLVRGDGLLYLT